MRVEAEIKEVGARRTIPRNGTGDRKGVEVYATVTGMGRRGW